MGASSLLSTLADKLNISHDMQDALLTVRDMGMAGVPPSTDTFNTLMSACVNRGDPASVPHLFRRLISLGHSPDALSYTSLIAALTRIERPRDAVSLCVSPITPRASAFTQPCMPRSASCASANPASLCEIAFKPKAVPFESQASRAELLVLCGTSQQHLAGAHREAYPAQVLAFEAMQADGRVAVDVAAWCAAAHAYAHCGRMPEAEACLHEATQRSQQRGMLFSPSWWLHQGCEECSSSCHQEREV